VRAAHLLISARFPRVKPVRYQANRRHKRSKELLSPDLALFPRLVIARAVPSRAVRSSTPTGLGFLLSAPRLATLGLYAVALRLPLSAYAFLLEF